MYDETIYVTNSDDEIIDAYENYDAYMDRGKKCNDCEEELWLAETVRNWFSENEDEREAFARYAGIDPRWLCNEED